MKIGQLFYHVISVVRYIYVFYLYLSLEMFFCIVCVIYSSLTSFFYMCKSIFTLANPCLYVFHVLIIINKHGN